MAQLRLPFHLQRTALRRRLPMLQCSTPPPPYSLFRWPLFALSMKLPQQQRTRLSQITKNFLKIPTSRNFTHSPARSRKTLQMGTLRCIALTVDTTGPESPGIARQYLLHSQRNGAKLTCSSIQPRNLQPSNRCLHRHRIALPQSHHRGHKGHVRGAQGAYKGCMRFPYTAKLWSKGEVTSIQ